MITDTDESKAPEMFVLIQGRNEDRSVNMVRIEGPEDEVAAWVLKFFKSKLEA